MISARVLIVEDEVLIAEDLKDYLLSFGIFKIEMAHSKNSAIRLIESHQPHVVLLDIRMEKETDGLDIGNLLTKQYKIPFIYITAHSDVAMVKEIIKTRPAGYITKPVRKSDLFAAISLVVEKQQSPEDDLKLKIKDGYSTQLISFSDILFIESEGNYINIYCEYKKFVSRQSLDSIIREMNDARFMRIHRSYLVNVTRITKFSRKEVLIGNKRLPVSRSAGDDLEKIMQK